MPGGTAFARPTVLLPHVGPCKRSAAGRKRVARSKILAGRHCVCPAYRFATICRPVQAKRRRAQKAQNKTGAKWLLFFCANLAQIIRAKVPAQTMTITEMPIKKYFTFHRSAYASVCLHEQSGLSIERCHRGGFKMRLIPHFTLAAAQNFGCGSHQTALMYA